MARKRYNDRCMRPAVVFLGALILIMTPMTGEAGTECSTVTGDPAAGEAVYNGTCTACHGPNGKGIIPGMPDLTKSGGSLSKPDDVLIGSITNGLESGTAPLAMPAKGGNPSLSDEDIVNVLGYLRKKFVC